MTPSLTRTDRLARIARLAAELADALAVHAAVEQNQIAFSDSRKVRALASVYSPQMTLDERFEHDDERRQ